MPPETVSEVNGGAYLATFQFARNLLASCPTVVLDVLGVADASDAKEKIYYQETLATDDEQVEFDSEVDAAPTEHEPRPYVVIIDGTRNRRLVGVGEWSDEGQAMAVFEVLVPSEYHVDRQADDSAVIREKFRARKRWAISMVGRIEDEISQNSGGNDGEGNEYLNVVDIELAVSPADPAEAESEDYIGFAINMTWK